VKVQDRRNNEDQKKMRGDSKQT